MHIASNGCPAEEEDIVNCVILQMIESDKCRLMAVVKELDGPTKNGSLLPFRIFSLRSLMIIVRLVQQNL